MAEPRRDGFIQLAHLAGCMAVLWRGDSYLDQPFWSLPADSLAVVCIAASVALAASRRWIKSVIAVSLTVGVCLALASVAAQSSGFRAHPRFVSEVGLNAPFPIFVGMLISAAPASILALRIGEMRLPPRTIAWTGVFGVWLPLLTSVVVVSFAKMWGVRLYWKPSVPVEFTFAFGWLFKPARQMLLMLPATTILAPCVVCACWFVDLTNGWTWRWPRITLLVALAMTGYAMASPDAWALYYPYWLLSIVFSCLLLGVARMTRLIASAVRASRR